MQVCTVRRAPMIRWNRILCLTNCETSRHDRPDDERMRSAVGIDWYRFGWPREWLANRRFWENYSRRERNDCSIDRERVPEGAWPERNAVVSTMSWPDEGIWPIWHDRYSRQPRSMTNIAEESRCWMRIVYMRTAYSVCRSWNGRGRWSSRRRWWSRQCRRVQDKRDSRKSNIVSCWPEVRHRMRGHCPRNPGQVWAPDRLSVWWWWTWRWAASMDWSGGRSFAARSRQRTHSSHRCSLSSWICQREWFKLADMMNWPVVLFLQAYLEIESTRSSFNNASAQSPSRNENLDLNWSDSFLRAEASLQVLVLLLFLRRLRVESLSTACHETVGRPLSRRTDSEGKEGEENHRMRCRCHFASIDFYLNGPCVKISSTCTRLCSIGHLALPVRALILSSNLSPVAAVVFSSSSSSALAVCQSRDVLSNRPRRTKENERRTRSKWEAYRGSSNFESIISDNDVIWSEPIFSSLAVKSWLVSKCSHFFRQTSTSS